MKKLSVKLDSIDQVKEFVRDMSSMSCDVFLCSGRYVIDAKSIMGIFSLDLSRKLDVEVEHWEEEYGSIFSKYSAD